jgi:hypothetical protein
MVKIIMKIKNNALQIVSLALCMSVQSVPEKSAIK